jgi:hypothetical protein
MAAETLAAADMAAADMAVETLAAADMAAVHITGDPVRRHEDRMHTSKGFIDGPDGGQARRRNY